MPAWNAVVRRQASAVLLRRLRRRSIVVPHRRSVSCWPDGTPKRFQDPKDNWKNFVNWESEYKDETDELNRARQFFFEVDSKGRLWRKELHQMGRRFGELKDGRVLDYFFGRVQRNRTGVYEEVFPWVSFRVHEAYYLRSLTSGGDGAIGAPVVLNDLRDGQLQYLCPQGEVAKSITTPFDPALVRAGSGMETDLRLYYPIRTKALVEDAPGRPRKYVKETVPALIDTWTSQNILEDAREGWGGDGTSEAAAVRRWGGGWDCTGGGFSGFELTGVGPKGRQVVSLMVLGHKL